MDIFNDNKKKNNEKKPFFQDIDEKPFAIDPPMDYQILSNKENTGYCPPIEDAVENAERQIDALFFRKQNPIDKVINDQKASPETTKVEKVQHQECIRNPDQINNETFSCPEIKRELSANPKNADSFDAVHPPTHIEGKSHQISKKPHSIPKIRVNFNKERFDYKDAIRQEQKICEDEKTSEKTEFIEETPKTSVTTKDTVPIPIRKRFVSDKDYMFNHEKTIKEKQLFPEKKSRSFLKENDTKNRSFAEKLKENNENKSIDVEHVPFNQQGPPLDDEVRTLLTITDELLGKLPEEVIAEFASSDGFVLYEKIMNKYHIK